MKILSHKRQKEIENRICKIQTWLSQDMDIDTMSQCTEELAEITYAVSGVQGMNNIIAYLNHKLQKEEEEQK